AHGDDLTLLGFFLGAVGYDNSPAHGFSLFHPPDQKAVVERSERLSFCCSCCHCFASPSRANQVGPGPLGFWYVFRNKSFGRMRSDSRSGCPADLVSASTRRLLALSPSNC